MPPLHDNSNPMPPLHDNSNPISSLHDSIDRLNPSQREAVTSGPGNILVSAGAGTGKTRVLTLRYGHLVFDHGVNPQNIMAVTFTNKAAFEMKKRLMDFFPVHQLWIGTFHSLGLRMLRQHHETINRAADFSVLDGRDQSTLVQKILKEKEVKKAVTPRMILDVISQWKHKMLDPKDIPSAPKPLYLEVYGEYQSRLRMMNCMDFDDLLLCSLSLMQQRPDLVQSYGFQHILVDEYQDINDLQYQWIKAFSDQDSSLFCVGDDDQSIYGWRGASIEKILRFEQDFPHTKTIYLEDNYRSTPHILSAASHLIGHNRERHGKVLRTSEKAGEKVHVQGLWDSGEEARFIADRIMEATKNGQSLSSTAVLVRTSIQTRELEECFSLQNIPYHIVGSARFYDRVEIRDIIGYLRIVHSCTDNLAFERTVNTPKRGIGPTTIQRLYDIVHEQDIPLEQSARLYCQQAKEGVVRTNLVAFLHLIDTWRQEKERLSLAELTQNILIASGYKAMWQEQGVQGQTRLENIKELLKSTESSESLEAFLEHASLLSETASDEDGKGISIMTLHAAKGLEFDTVFLPGWEENLFPHIRCVEESGQKGVEEERRLAYVGLTRARKKSIISFCWNRKGHQGFMPSAPSRFINELPQDDVDMVLKIKNTFTHPSAQHQKKVMHATFGKGTVQSQSGLMVSVLFERHGLKKIMTRFLNFM